MTFHFFGCGERGNCELCVEKNVTSEEIRMDFLRFLARCLLTAKCICVDFWFVHIRPYHSLNTWEEKSDTVETKSGSLIANQLLRKRGCFGRSIAENDPGFTTSFISIIAVEHMFVKNFLGGGGHIDLRVVCYVYIIRFQKWSVCECVKRNDQHRYTINTKN
jgi:hypothetical protein